MEKPEEPQNPFQAPSSEELGTSKPKPNKTFLSFLWMFVVPFLLAHLIFWPTWILLAQLVPATRGDYGIPGAMNALLLATVLGGVYGLCVGRFMAGKSWGVSCLYGLGEFVWFPFSIIAPCALFVF